MAPILVKIGILLCWFCLGSCLYWNKLCKLIRTNMIIFVLNSSGSKGRVPQRYWHHLWVCWRWHVKLVLECFGCPWTTHCYWHDFSGFSFFFFSSHSTFSLHSTWKFHCIYNILCYPFFLRGSTNSFSDCKFM